MKPLTLGKASSLESVRTAASDSTPLDQVISDSLASVPSGPGLPAAGGSSGGDGNGFSAVGTSGNSPAAPIATLDVGSGNQLPVSPGVAQALRDAIRESTSSQSPGESGSTGANGSTGDGAVGNGLPAVGSVLPLLLEDVVTYPGQNGDIASAAESQVAETSMPEPASLLLLAAGLAVGGIRLRRKT